MFIELRPNDPRPIYRQIADEFQRAIGVEVLRPGDALPAVRSLAAELKVNANTVQHAYRTLVEEEVIEMRRGLGAFVAATPPREGRQNSGAVARQIAERALRDAFKHGLLASDLLRALEEIAPKRSEPA